MNTGSVTVTDLLLGGVLLLFAVRGLITGLVKELFSLAAVVAGWLTASRYHIALADRYPALAGSELLTKALVFAVLFVVAALGVRLLGWAIDKVLSDTPLGWINRFLGGMCGFAAGVITVGVLLLVLTTYIPAGRGVFRGSLLYPRLTGVVELLAVALPERGRELFEKHLLRPDTEPAESLKELILHRREKETDESGYLS